MTKRMGSLVLMLAGAVTMWGCAASDMGATPGGAQDNDLANRKIEENGVPKPDDITVEGMLNSHDLPLESAPCTKELCIQAAYGIAPTMDRQRASAFVQIGFSSGIDRTTFRRAPLNLAVVVDHSGSMQGEKILAVRTALSKLIDQLGEADRLSIVLFNQTVSVLLPSTPVSDRESIRALLSGISANGTTDMAAGLRAGYDQVAAHTATTGVSDRVMLLTDARANQGEIDTTSFVELASTYGQQGVGLSLFGVGTDLNQDLVLAMSRLRGGSYYFLSDAQKIATVFDEDFDFLVTPLAYDLRLRLDPGAAYELSAVYGYSTWTTGRSSFEIDVATVFLSRNHGAIVVRMDPRSGWPTEGSPLAELSLTYTTAENAPVTDAEQLAYAGTDPLGDSTVFYSERGVRKSVALINAALGMRSACASFWNSDRASAHTTLVRTRDLLVNESSALGDLELSDQAATVQQLDTNMSGAKRASYDNEREDDHGLALCSLVPGRHNPGASAAILGLWGLAFLGRRRALKETPRWTRAMRESRP